MTDKTEPAKRLCDCGGVRLQAGQITKLVLVAGTVHRLPPQRCSSVFLAVD